ncbi:uncharacterized protein LOC143183236 [Calliopsis andreniformis]|uniref:uncharacterized protein LOC143183236 n=1 Tax=Calliopsis andreniformis TaxID=337506 RepID=UPI003FCEAAC7
MDANTIEERYLKITKRLAILAGLWPYQTGYGKYFSRVLIILIGLSCILPQVAYVVTFFSLDVLVLQCPLLAVGFGIVIKECAYVIHQSKLRSLFDDILKDWGMKRSKKEYEILEFYSKRAVLFTSLYNMNGLVCFAMFVQMPITPQILDLIIPLNESREIVFLYPAYYYIDEKKYLILIIANMTSSLAVVYVVYITYDTTYVFLVHHACALLAISGHRFKCAVPTIFTQKERNAKFAEETYRKICYSIQEHQHAFRHHYSIDPRILPADYNGFDNDMFQRDVNEGISFDRHLMYLELGIDARLFHLLLITLPGQMVINENENVYQAMCKSLWYNATTRGQALYIIALRKSQVLNICAAGNFVTMNLQSLLMVVKTGVSYCMKFFTTDNKYSHHSYY